MDKLTWDFRQITNRNRDGSFGTQAERFKVLSKVAADLKSMGFRNMRATSLKPKHVDSLIAKWRQDKLSVGTIKNKMSHLRWWAEKVNKTAAIAKDNITYGLENRQFVTNEDKSLREIESQLEQMDHVHINAALQLQRAFGLRREEAMKFQPVYADKGETILLKHSWTKGGREREIPVLNEIQRKALDNAHKVAGKGSLIPSDKSYVEHMRLFERETIKVGLSKTHGLRHAYAQDRYKEITGWLAPARGGRKYSELSVQEKVIDEKARQLISRELGHERIQVTSVYIGGRS